MALINRVTRLFQADMHAVLDRIEEPDMLLRQAVRDMEAALNDDVMRIKQLTHEQLQIQLRQQELSSSLDKIETSLDTCLQSEQDDLARQVIKRKLETQQLHDIFKNKNQLLKSQLQSLQKQTSEQRERLESMQQKLEIFGEDHSTHFDERRGLQDIDIKNTDIEVALLQEKQRRSKS